jgi:hypothetical protein
MSAASKCFAQVSLAVGVGSTRILKKTQMRFRIGGCWSRLTIQYCIIVYLGCTALFISYK